MIKRYSPDELKNLISETTHYYESNADSFWEHTKDHDVSQNYQALLTALPAKKGLRILDFGCGPGRDLLAFKSMGHLPTGLDASPTFCERARRYSGCKVLNQDFIALRLEPASFDGIFANASLFHVPKQELPRVLAELKSALVPGGILFTSNPRGNAEGFSGGRYANFMELEEYREFLDAAGFTLLHHYYRPSGKPRSEQPWLAVVSQSREDIPY